MRDKFALRIKSLALLVVALCTTCSAGADESSRGFVLGGSCLNCHSLDSSSIKGIPSLKAHSESTIAEALFAYKAGTRDGTIMGRLARGYSDEEIAVIAKWLKRDKR